MTLKVIFLYTTINRSLC